MSTPNASVKTGVTTTPPPNPVSEPRNPASAETANTIPENTSTFIGALSAPPREFRLRCATAGPKHSAFCLLTSNSHIPKGYQGRSPCPSLLRFPLQPRAVQNLHLMALDPHQPFGTKSRQVPRHHFAHRTQPRSEEHTSEL